MTLARPVVDPRTEEVIEQLDLLRADEVGRVARAAARAAVVWADTPLAARCARVARLADDLAGQAEGLARDFSAEHGKTPVEAAAELARAVETLHWAAGAGPRLTAEVALAARDGLDRVIRVEPAGPVLAIVPWNFPAVILARKLGPALVAGCSVVVKGPEQTPRVARAFVAAATRAGLPSDVVQLVFAHPPEVQALLRCPEFAHITFTGSPQVGRLVAGAAASVPTACTLELGGHAPAIVDVTADVGHAVAQLVGAKFGTTGQSCGAPSRFIVHRAVHDEFVARFVAAATGLDLGPLNNARRRDDVHALVADARDRGATVRLGGRMPAGRGFHYPPTVLTDVPPTARILHEEPFGPVAPIIRCGGEEEAVTIANASDYALSAYVFGSPEVARRTASRLRAGNVMLNAAAGAPPDAPLGGRGISGYGYEGGDDGFRAFCRLKLVQGRPS